MLLLLVVPAMWPLDRYAGAWPCSVSWFSQGDVKLQLSECLQSRVVTPSTNINFTVTLTNVGSSVIGLRAGPTGRDPFELDLYNGTGELVFVWGYTGGYYRRSLQPGASVPEFFGWAMTDIIPQIGNNSRAGFGRFHLQAFLDSPVVAANGTQIISSHQVAGSIFSFEVVAQLIFPYDVFELVTVVLLGVNIIVSLLLVMEIREIKRRIPRPDKGQDNATKRSDEEKAGQNPDA